MRSDAETRGRADCPIFDMFRAVALSRTVDGIAYEPEIKTEKINGSGLNFNLGLSYDISNSFFVQSYFHYIRIYRKSPITDKMTGVNYNQLKFGLGYRF